MRMRRSLTFGLPALVVIAVLLVLFAPPQLGGSTVYTATVGNSMEPRFHKGDLAITRPASSYNVGDIVLYESPVLHRPVLHRIKVIQDGRYYFKGDHNDFVDPGYATRGELLGKLWLRIPKAGRALSWIGAPLHAGIFAAMAMLLLILGGAGRVRRRRSSMREAMVRLSDVHASAHVAEHVVGFVVLAAGVLALAAGFSAPLKRTVPLVNAYQHDGTFSYSGITTHRSDAYPNGYAETGQPLFLSVVKTANVVFAYRFRSRFAHSVHGTIGLSAQLSSDASTWHHSYVLAKAQPFDGDNQSLHASVALQQVRQLIAGLAVESGTVASQYNVEVRANVHATGIVGGHRIDDHFISTLPFVLTDSTLRLDVQPAATIPGASYTPPSAQSALTAALNPTQAGSIPTVIPNTVTLVRFRVLVTLARELGLALVGIVLLVLLTRPLRRRRERRPLDRRIVSRAGGVMVDVVALEHTTGPRIEIESFESLAALATYVERPILHDAAGETYAVDLDGQRYIYKGRTAPVSRPRVDVPIPKPRRAATGRFRIARRVAIGLSFAIAIVLATSFTAANTVPLSHAGVSSDALSLAELAPSECAGISLAHLVVATGATTTGTTGNDLILGKSGSGTFTLNGGGGDDCIVAGGGAGTTNNINGGGNAGDVCIGAPGAKNNFSKCAKTY
jgi:signal peptidase I